MPETITYQELKPCEQYPLILEVEGFKRVLFTRHAYARLGERGITVESILETLTNLPTAEYRSRGVVVQESADRVKIVTLWECKK